MTFPARFARAPPCMATNLDLQEQEQLDELKAFWKQYGNLVTWALILALGAFAACNGWNWYQRDQATKAGAMFDELERAAQANDALRGGIAPGLGVAGGLDQLVDDVLGRRHVGIAHAEVDDVHTLGAETRLALLR